MGAEKEEKEGEAGMCSYCEKRKALLYCRADAAALCLDCDRHVHAANTVSSKHPRSLLCDSCRSSPSSIFIPSSPSLLLCSNCDFHNNSSEEQQQQRRPVEPFSGCPSAQELASLLGAAAGGDLLKEDDEEDNYDVDTFLLDRPLPLQQQQHEHEHEPVVGVVRMEDLLIGPTASFQASQAIIPIPPPSPLSKDRYFTCGKQKEEILRQLRDLAKSESQLPHDYQELGPVSEFLSVPLQENLQEDKFYYNFDADATFTPLPNNEV